MSKYSIQNLIVKTSNKIEGKELFELENEYLLAINLTNNEVMIKKGAMVSYTGNVAYKREGILSKGVTNLLKKAVSGEGTSMMKAKGAGTVFIADLAKKIHIIHLDNEAIHVNGNDILAHEMQIKSDIKMMKSVAGMLGGGLFQVRLEGNGHIAITTHGNPITMQVKPGQPIFTDPNATVAWSGNLQPRIKTDVSLKTFIGRGSGESIQMMFEGDGWVVVQPYEETYLTMK